MGQDYLVVAVKLSYLGKKLKRYDQKDLRSRVGPVGSLLRS